MSARRAGRLAPLSTLQPAGRVTEHCPTGIRALSDASGNRGLFLKGYREPTSALAWAIFRYVGSTLASLARTILEEHLTRGELVPGQEIAISVDQTLAQDATGTMAMMQFELFGHDRVEVETAVVYVDHNILQIDFKNPDDHRFLQGMAARYGLWFSRPGNGICHYVHCERFAVPGKTLVGADSHTTQSGSCGMIAIGAGGIKIGDPASWVRRVHG